MLSAAGAGEAAADEDVMSFDPDTTPRPVVQRPSPPATSNSSGPATATAASAAAALLSLHTRGVDEKTSSVSVAPASPQSRASPPPSLMSWDSYGPYRPASSSEQRRPKQLTSAAHSRPQQHLSYDAYLHAYRASLAFSSEEVVYDAPDTPRTPHTPDSAHHHHSHHHSEKSTEVSEPSYLSVPTPQPEAGASAPAPTVIMSNTKRASLPPTFAPAPPNQPLSAKRGSTTSSLGSVDAAASPSAHPLPLEYYFTSDARFWREVLPAPAPTTTTSTSSGGSAGTAASTSSSASTSVSAAASTSASACACEDKSVLAGVPSEALSAAAAANHVPPSAPSSFVWNGQRVLFCLLFVTGRL
jgi:hypothetical protein